jgi:hypothetical protein
MTIALVTLALAASSTGEPPKRGGAAERARNSPAQRPRGIELIVSAVGVSRKPGATDTYILSVSVQNWGKTEQPAGVLLRATRTVADSGGEDATIVQEINLPKMTPLMTRHMNVEYRITNLAAAPAIFGLTKFELLSRTYRGTEVTGTRPFTDFSNRNNTSQITGTDLVAKIRAL